jgi:glucose/arabinose dehydrogenase/cytochrome c553
MTNYNRRNFVRTAALAVVTPFFMLLLISYIDKPVSKSMIKPVQTNSFINKIDTSRLETTTVIDRLNGPWELLWGPDNHLWFTEQDGKISKVNPKTGKRTNLIHIREVYKKRLALLSMAIHPDFKKHPFVFVNYIFLRNSAVFSKLVRYEYAPDTLINPVVLMEYPAYTGHMGSRMLIAPDGKLLWATGDGQHRMDSQDTNSVKGKVLRLNIDGSIPDDNPIKGSPVWAWGFRVPQGMTLSTNGNLYTAEHGDAIGDEVNLVVKGANYGWPHVEGNADLKEEMTFAKENNSKDPLLAWTPTVAPAGLAYYDSNAIPELKNALLMVTLKTQTLRILKLNPAGDKVLSETVALEQKFGRLRSICVSPEGEIFVSTSNRDWNPGPGYPKLTDDKIIKISYRKSTALNAKALPLTKKPVVKTQTGVKRTTPSVKTLKLSSGAIIYNNYCSSCHKPNGSGLAGMFPPLNGATQVIGKKDQLIKILLKGLSGPIVVKGVKYDQEMPAFNFLSDAQIAAVATYIRTSFGNKASVITKEEIKAARDRK